MGEGSTLRKVVGLQGRKGDLVGGTGVCLGNGRKGVFQLPSTYVVPGTGLGALHGFLFHLQEPPVK